MLGAWLLVTRLSAKTASILFFALAGAVLILCVAEMYTPLRGFSDRARDILYSDRFIYASDLRDMELHGSFRPRVFTQEPSHVAKFVLGMILAWLAVSCLRFRLPIAFGFGAVAAWALRSPTLFALLPGVVILSATRLEMDWVRLRSGRLLVETAVVLVVVLGIIFAGDILKLTGSERLARIANEEDASANIRFFGPLALTGAVWGDYPAFGAGIGGKELVHDHLIDVFSGLQGMRMERFQFGTSVGWGSAFFEFFIYHGIIGSIVGLAGLALLSRAAGHGRLLTTLLLLTLLMFNDSGFTSFRVWTYFGIITGALTLNAQNQRRFGIPKVRRPVPATTIDAAPPPPGDPKRHVAA